MAAAPTPHLSLGALPVAPSEPLTLGVAARLLGMKGSGRSPEQRLRRYLLLRERVLSTEFMIRSGGDRQLRYRVTLAMLRQHCPELFDTRTETEEVLREQVEEIEERLARLQRQDELIAAKLARVEETASSAPAREAAGAPRNERHKTYQNVSPRRVG